MALLQNATQFYNFIQSNYLQILSFLGILITIAISYSSFTLQRNARARESLEQLEDIKVGRAKIKPILHKYRPWPRSQAIVILKVYLPTDVANVGQPTERFLAVPDYVFEGHEVEAREDGYYVTIQSSNPVAIRRVADGIMERMGIIGHRGNSWNLLPFDAYAEQFQPAVDGENSEIHKEILSILSDGDTHHISDIQNQLGDQGYYNALGGVAIRDLEFRGEVEEIERNKYAMSTSKA